MPELKLAKLPDRTPVKLAITVTPDLHQMLQQYAALYAEAYGREESVIELVPAMLTAFLDADRSFQKSRVGRKGAKGQGRPGGSSMAPPFLSNEQAASFLNLSPRTLEKMRVVGGGPPFCKFGRRVTYAVGDLEAWAANRRCNSTSDPACKGP